MAATDATLFDMRKAMILIIIFAAIIIIPLILVSSPLFNLYQGWIDKPENHTQDAGFAKWLQWSMGRIAGWMGREERAADAYGHYIEYWSNEDDLTLEDPDVPAAYYWYAYWLADDHHEEHALEVIRDFMAVYPDHPLVDKVQNLRDRILYVGN